MEQYHKIQDKLNRFIRKYYTRQLIQGSLLFLSLGLLFWIVVTALEYFLWLSQNGRFTLFAIFLAVELFLLYRFVVIPLAYLFRIKQGLSSKTASRLIGTHFPHVADKLINLLELSENKVRSELVAASIVQRAKQLEPIPFSRAVTYRESYKYAKYVLLPVVLLGSIWASGYMASFFNSHIRIVQYHTPFVRPAPFAFNVLNDSLEVLDTEPLPLKVVITGAVQPGKVFVVMDGDTLLLHEQNGQYTHTFKAPVPQSSFYLTANGWNSRPYTIKRYKPPVLINFRMQLYFPKYLKRKSETLVGTGNAVLPEGTQVAWHIEGKNVENITLSTQDTTLLLQRHTDTFIHTERIFSDLSYTMSTSNAHVTHFETLHYTLEVVKDQKPTVHVTQILDSLQPNQSFYIGQATDDYGLSQIRLVCYPSDDVQAVQRIVLESPRTPIHQFYYTFPSGLQLEAGKHYTLYFEIVDNDGLRQGKVTRSQTFDATVYDNNKLINKTLEFQNVLLNQMNQSLNHYKTQKEVLSQITRQHKEKSTLTFEDKTQIKAFLQQQQNQEKLLEKLSRQFNESLDKSQGDSDLEKLLQERLERQEQEAQKHKKLLEELNAVTRKMNKETLAKRLEQLGKNQSRSVRNLEQILALTQRYYITEKMAQLARELENLARKQENISNDSLKQTPEKAQQRLNQTFERLSKVLDTLRKDNATLQKPVRFDVSQPQQQAVTNDQQRALDALRKASATQDTKDTKAAQQKAYQRQKAAAQKLREMSQVLQQSFKSSAASNAEDATVLRQILDNLVAFSFAQEALFHKVGDTGFSQFSKILRNQKDLRSVFEHVDDSLFVLSLRRAELSEFVNTQIAEVYYNLDKVLESIAENQLYRGALHQQYTLHATNALADFLARTLDNLQQKIQFGKGEGKGLDFQLPDIIQGQQDLQEKMEDFGKGGKQKSGTASQKGKGNSEQDRQEGQKRNGSKAGAEGYSEKELQELYELYKQQQYLREQLEKQVKNLMENSDKVLAKKLLQRMEGVEGELLEKGITQRTRHKVNTIQHQLLQLENATLRQGEKRERESSTSSNAFTNPIRTKPEFLKDDPNTIELLNRQALPLQPTYQQRVKDYFNND